jgi:hypothetical protein
MANRMNIKIAAAICFISLCSSSSAPPINAAPRTYQPKPGSIERKAILDTLRKPISKDLKKKVIFKVYQLKICDGWAWAVVTALRPDGSALGEDDFWGSAQGLLRKRGNKWQVLVSGIATDVAALEETQKKYPNAPQSIFKEDKR